MGVFPVPKASPQSQLHDLHYIGTIAMGHLRMYLKYRRQEFQIGEMGQPGVILTMTDGSTLL